LPADKKAPIETALNKLKEAHKSQNLSAIDSAIAEMNNAWTAASEELYKATQQAGGQGPGGQQGGGPDGGHEAHAGSGENVTDAEFEEVK
jgi:molecular chaperone DnaK